MYGLDYATPTLANDWFTFLKGSGYGFVIRYLSDHTGGKVITAGELTAIHGASLGLGLVWETTAERPIGTGTYTDSTFTYWSSSAAAELAGSTDGAAAAAQAASVGYPANKPIYFAVDFDIDYNNPTLRRTLVAAYFKGVAESVPMSRIGVYGGRYALELCQSHALATWYWQTSSWSSTTKLSYAHFYQDRNNDVNLGYSGHPSCDLDITLKANIDQFLWMPDSPKPVDPTPIVVGPESTTAQVVISNVTTTGFQWKVTGLQSPFTKAYYIQAKISDQPTVNAGTGWYSLITAWQTSSDYLVKETQVNTISSFTASATPVTKTLYAWVQAANGTWYPITGGATGGTYTVTLKATQTPDQVVSGITTNTVMLSTSTNSLTVTGLENGKDYYFRLKVTRTDKNGTVSVYSDQIKLTPQKRIEVIGGGSSSKAMMTI